jgi:hypothetical protein
VNPVIWLVHSWVIVVRWPSKNGLLLCSSCGRSSVTPFHLCFLLLNGYWPFNHVFLSCHQSPASTCCSYISNLMLMLMAKGALAHSTAKESLLPDTTLEPISGAPIVSASSLLRYLHMPWLRQCIGEIWIWVEFIFYIYVENNLTKKTYTHTWWLMLRTWYVANVWILMKYEQ